MQETHLDDLLISLTSIEAWAAAYCRVDCTAGNNGLFDDDTVEALLAEAQRLANDVFKPLAQATDLQHPVLENARVRMPEGWVAAYRDWADSGWMGLGVEEALGGQGAPNQVAAAALEIWNASSAVLGIGASLTLGAIDTIAAYADPAIRSRYLPDLVAGRALGTMNLTESQAGTDLSLLRTKAEANPDGSFALTGEKIFITFGAHDLTDNIIHLVLARLPEAPAGNKGISLFLCPAMLDCEDGGLAPNRVVCRKLENKIGLHGSPTAVMGFDGAKAHLLGAPHQGLAAMFTMMNAARIMVGIQGTAVAQAAFDLAHQYAHNRPQGRAKSWAGAGPAPIIHHPDVREMLLSMEALTAAARLVSLAAAQAADAAKGSKTEGFWQRRVDLLTPLAKAYPTDIGEEVASLGIQVHGGMGYIEDSGAGRLYRDARIFRIYEGTNGIQALDLLQRKLPDDGPGGINDLLAEMNSSLAQLSPELPSALADMQPTVHQALTDVRASTVLQQQRLARGELDSARAGATIYLRQLADALAGCLLLTTVDRLVAADDPAARRWAGLARHFIVTRLSRSGSHVLQVTETGASLQADGWPDRLSDI